MTKNKKAYIKNPSQTFLLNEKPFEEQLRLKNRALTSCAEGVTIADATQPDCPLIYVNNGFEKLTGYSATETCGTNCRFLQGKDTDPKAIEEIRQAVNEKRECIVELINYRKNGQPFWNRLSITPIHDQNGNVTHFIGVQSDVTTRRNAEDALKVTNAKLERANLIIKKDLQTAAKIQESILPPHNLNFSNIKASWKLIPCDELAGDTLNIFCLNDRYIIFYVLDVSGHGVQASLLSVTLNHWLSPKTIKMNNESVNLKESATPSATAPIEVLNQLNHQFPFDPKVGQYFTIAYGVLDSLTNRFSFIAAGHPPPLYVPLNSKPEFKIVDNFPVGIVSDASFKETTIQMKKGDRIFLFSDGLLETTNNHGEFYGEKRLADKISKLCNYSLESSLTSLIVSLEDWSDGDSFQDDISVLGFEIK